MTDHDMPDRCWCSRSSWDGHKHSGFVPVSFGKASDKSPVTTVAICTFVVALCGLLLRLATR